MKSRLFALLLAVSLSMTSIPVTARAEKMTSESVSENTTVGILEDQKQKNQECIDIYSLDWKTASTDEINDAVYAADFVELGGWLSAMPEDERQELLEKDTYLHNKVQVLSADPAGNGYNKVSGNEDPELWEFSMAQAQMETGEDVSVQTADADDGIAVQSEDDAIDAVGAAASLGSVYRFGQSSGHYSIGFHVVNADGSSTYYGYKMVVSGVSKKVDIVYESDEVNLALVIPSGVPEWLGFSMTKSVPGSTEKLKRPVKLMGSGEGYQTLQDYFKFTKPVGYVMEWCTGGGGMKYSNLFVNDNNNYASTLKVFTNSSNSMNSETYGLRACVDILDMGIDIVNNDTGKTSKKSPGAGSFSFWLAPIKYSVGYHPNGATGGSVPAQSCVYGQTYTPSGNAYNRTYAMTYNANRGNASKVSENVSYDFLGWGWENTGVVTHTPSTAFANLTSVNGGYAGTFYAVWQPKSTVLPTANRTGYKFAGWISHADGKTYGGGTAFTPVCNTQMTAQWQANTYTLKFNSNGGKDLRNLSAVYDSEVALPTPERAGYTFKGWTCNGKTYNGTAKNLTDKDGEVMELTAQWQANTDTPYKVVHMVEVTEQEAVANGDYEKKDDPDDPKNESKKHFYIPRETENLTGTTDEKVTVTPKSYKDYVFDTAESATIAGDGSTVVRCFYRLDEKELLFYSVEHYLQSREDKTQYILDEANSTTYQVEEGTSVTPDVITTYEGYNIPNPQTVTITDDGTVIKYYYTLKDADKSTGNNSGNGSGTNTGTNTGSHVKESSGSDNAYSDNNNFKSGEIKYYTDAEGNVYTIYINPDGTVTVMNVKPAKKAGSNLSVAGTITVNGFKYQVSEIAPYAFKNNKKIKTVTIGKGITKIGKGAFYGCTKLKTVKGCQTLKEIGSLAFYKCTSLEKMASSKPLETIGSKAFYNCKKLKKYTIGKYTKNIGSEAFRNCKKLKSITVSESVEIIGKRSFYGCKNLKKVDMKTTKLLKVGSAAFKKCNKNIKFVLQAKTAKKYKKLLRNKS